MSACGSRMHFGSIIGRIFLPHPAFFHFYCKQRHLPQSTLGRPLLDAWATLGWPLGHAWVTQGSPNPNHAEGRNSRKLPIVERQLLFFQRSQDFPAWAGCMLFPNRLYRFLFAIVNLD
jgi:uncharacterized protein (DUF3820 family)